MWQWFTTNGIWIIIASGVGLILLLFIRERVQALIEKTAEKKPRKTLGKNVNLTAWVLEGVLIVVIAFALVAVIASREGVKAVITPETIEQWFLKHGIFIISIVLVGIGLWYALKHFLPPLVRRTVVRAKGESKEGIRKRTETLTSVFMGIGKVAIIIIIIFMILSELAVPIGPILAGFGIVGIAIGFGAQYLIRDLIAGIFILWENQYRVGDVARVADVAGLVEQVNLRKTVLRDLDGIVHHIPNGEIRVASNFTRHFSRVNLNISVAYGTDLDHAISVINRVGKELAADEQWGKMIKTPPQVLRVDNLGDSGIELKILGDVQPIKQWDIMGQLRLRIKKAFDAEGIEIPWPHVKLYFGQSQAEGGLTCKACSRPNPPGSKFCSNCGANLSS
ncbi:MAG TPA: mechanosensitive ion channel domain-containing protein [Dehalococcoidales bacterium]|nr:mechanosensitive ion channel domain-containing protein [Dehalococcoidales bacterium]